MTMIDAYLYRGAHRAPVVVPGGRALAAGALALALPLATASTASADVLDEIERCESSGNENASNGSHFGLFQFDLPTWRSVGGTGDPRDASRAEQRSRAEALLSKRGTQPWDASSSCWSKRADAVAAGRAPARVVETPKARVRSGDSSPRARVAPKPAPKTLKTARGSGLPDGYRVKSGDTLSQLAARYSVPGGYRAIAVGNGIPNPNLIIVGQVLR